MKKLIFLLFLSITCLADLQAENSLQGEITPGSGDTSMSNCGSQGESMGQSAEVTCADSNPNKVIRKIRDKIKKRKKVIAACLAFPVPFGIIGLHRIYLGTEPYIPLIYIGTLGGCVGVLPLIDFIAILAEKDITRYEHNKKVFMWIK